MIKYLKFILILICILYQNSFNITKPVVGSGINLGSLGCLGSWLGGLCNRSSSSTSNNDDPAYGQTDDNSTPNAPESTPGAQNGQPGSGAGEKTEGIEGNGSSPEGCEGSTPTTPSGGTPTCGSNENSGGTDGFGTRGSSTLTGGAGGCTTPSGGVTSTPAGGAGAKRTSSSAGATTPSGGSSPPNGTGSKTKKANDSGKNDGIELDISKKDPGTEYHVQKGFIGSLYFGKDGKKIKCVKDGSKVVWTASNESENASSVRANEDTLTIHCDTGGTKTFVKESPGCCTWSWCCLFTCAIYNCCAKEWKEDKPSATNDSNTSGGSCNGSDCSFSWKCLFTCGMYNSCCKDKCN